MVVPVSDEILVQEIDSLQLQTGRYSFPFFGIAVLFLMYYFWNLHMTVLSTVAEFLCPEIK